MRCSASPKRQSSTHSAFSEKSEKFVPSPSQVAPSGNGRPGQTSIAAIYADDLAARSLLLPQRDLRAALLARVAGPVRGANAVLEAPRRAARRLPPGRERLRGREGRPQGRDHLSVALDLLDHADTAGVVRCARPELDELAGLAGAGQRLGRGGDPVRGRRELKLPGASGVVDTRDAQITGAPDEERLELIRAVGRERLLHERCRSCDLRGG